MRNKAKHRPDESITDKEVELGVRKGRRVNGRIMTDKINVEVKEDDVDDKLAGNNGLLHYALMKGNHPLSININHLTFKVSSLAPDLLSIT